MEPNEIDKRLADIEARLARIEARLTPAPPAQTLPPTKPEPPAERRVPSRLAEDRPALITNILGWGGAAALVLAVAYLIRLAVENGWLTPVRQVGCATIFGFGLIAIGFLMRGSNRRYAGLLPAGGIAVLFLATYGAHLFYGLILAATATAAVALICLASLWLCREFESDLYALFAVAGSYSAPVLIAGVPSIVDLAIYFSAWGVVFSVFAVWRGNRLVYLLAAYLALLVFDYIRSARAPEAWVAALVFQTVQLAIFGVATITYSIRRRSALDPMTATAHLPALLIFYFLQYALLDRYLPGLAPWIAVASGCVVVLLYLVARVALGRELPGGQFLLWAYIALVLFHAGYLEALPHRWAPWVAFIALPIAAVGFLRTAGEAGTRWPVWAAVVLVFVVNYLRVIFDTDVGDVPGRPLLAVAYAAQLYLGYYLVRHRPGARPLAALLLYAGHVGAMAAALHTLTEPIVESAAWAVLALASIWISLWRRDRVLGQSSLLVFAAAAVKVLLFDLGGASPFARIASLVVLGVAFYLGGLLYQRLQAVPTGEAEAPD